VHASEVSIGTGLEIRAGQEGSTYIVRLVGEVDFDGAPAVDRALRQAEATDAERILLDVDGLDFIDSAGLEALLRAAQRSELQGRRLRLTRGVGFVADMFRLTALDQTLPFV
jgi:anti-anti-sigma factor